MMYGEELEMERLKLRGHILRAIKQTRILDEEDDLTAKLLRVVLNFEDGKSEKLQEDMRVLEGALDTLKEVWGVQMQEAERHGH